MMQAPSSRIPPVRAATVASDLYNKPCACLHEQYASDAGICQFSVDRAMSPWWKVRLGKVLTHRKEFTTIDGLTDYKRLRTDKGFRGVLA